MSLFKKISTGVGLAKKAIAGGRATLSRLSRHGSTGASKTIGHDATRTARRAKQASLQRRALLKRSVVDAGVTGATAGLAVGTGVGAYKMGRKLTASHESLELSRIKKAFARKGNSPAGGKPANIIPHASNGLKQRGVGDYLKMRFGKAASAAGRMGATVAKHPLTHVAGATAALHKMTKRSTDTKEERGKRFASSLGTGITGTVSGHAAHGAYKMHTLAKATPQLASQAKFVRNVLGVRAGLYGAAAAGGLYAATKKNKHERKGKPDRVGKVLERVKHGGDAVGHGLASGILGAGAVLTGRHAIVGKHSLKKRAILGAVAAGLGATSAYAARSAYKDGRKAAGFKASHKYDEPELTGRAAADAVLSFDREFLVAALKLSREDEGLELAGKNMFGVHTRRGAMGSAVQDAADRIFPMPVSSGGRQTADLKRRLGRRATQTKLLMKNGVNAARGINRATAVGATALGGGLLAHHLMKRRAAKSAT